MKYEHIDDVPANDIPAAVEFVAFCAKNGTLSDGVIEPLLNRQRDPHALMAAISARFGSASPKP